MIVAAKEQRQHIRLTGTNLITIVVYALHHHIEMVAIRQVITVDLVHTLMKIVGRLPYLCYLYSVFVFIRHKFFLRHSLMIATWLQNYEIFMNYES